MNAEQKIIEVHDALGALLAEMRTYPPSVPPAVYQRVEQIRESMQRDSQPDAALEQLIANIDPSLSEESQAAVEAMFRATYDKLRELDSGEGHTPAPTADEAFEAWWFGNTTPDPELPPADQRRRPFYHDGFAAGWNAHGEVNR